MSDPPHDEKEILDAFAEVFDGFRGPRRAELAVTHRISLRDVDHGAEHEIAIPRRVRCDACDGHGGATGATKSECDACGGVGRRRETRGALAFEQTCPACRGAGHRWSATCSACDGRGEHDGAPAKVTITTPPGVADGATLRLAGHDDLHVTVVVSPHEVLTRDGDHLRARVRLDAGRATKDGTLVVPWLEGDAHVPLPSGSRAGDELRLAGWGLTKLGSTYAPPPTPGTPYRTAEPGRGDLIVTLVDDAALAGAYRTLGLAPGASHDQIKAAYRRLAIAHHPQRHPDRPDAAKTFAKVQAAYDALLRPIASEPAAPTEDAGAGLRVVALGLGILVVFVLAYLALR
jgi:DnaJ-class molecular chaperone